MCGVLTVADGSRAEVSCSSGITLSVPVCSYSCFCFWGNSNEKKMRRNKRNHRRCAASAALVGNVHN